MLMLKKSHSHVQFHITYNVAAYRDEKKSENIKSSFYSNVQSITTPTVNTTNSFL